MLNYNITYVDWVGLPIAMDSTGGGTDCKPVGCMLARDALLGSCPAELVAGARCLSAGNYCSQASNKNKPFCTKLDQEIVRCATTKTGCDGANGAKTPEVYGCAPPFFSTSPKWCSALNRGMLDNPDSTDLSLYYTREPFNAYSKWVHERCPGIYAFPYDDYPSAAGESGFHSCKKGKELRVTFCPAG